MTTKLKEKTTEKATDNMNTQSFAPTYPRREALGIGYPEASLAASFKHDANTGHRTAEDFANATANFENFYASWMEKETLLKEATEALALVTSPPTYSLVAGNNLLFDGLLDQLERGESEERRLQILALAREKLADVQTSRDYLYCGVLWFAILADHFDEQMFWEPWQEKYNEAIGKAEAILEEASAEVESAKAPDIHRILSNKIYLPSAFYLTDRKLDRWTGDAAKGYSK